MRIVSINVGRPRLIHWKGVTINTGIFKEPVQGPVMLRKTNFDGDRQADLSVHGGPNKAAYGYPLEHYSLWNDELPENDLPLGAFGENLTIEGLLEKNLSVGDTLRAGAAILKVRTPRLPCFKLAAKFNRDDMIERFLRSGRCGYYFSVEQEGEISSGDEIEFLDRAPGSLSVFEINRLYAFASPGDLSLLRRAAQVEALPESWRERFQGRADAILKLASN